MSEHAQEKESAKETLSKKRGAEEADVDSDNVLSPISNVTHDVRKFVDTVMFDFGQELDTRITEDQDRDIGDGEFINESRINAKSEFDNVIKLLISYMPE